MRRFKGLGWVLGAVVVGAMGGVELRPTEATAQSATRTYTLSVTVDPHKPDGSAWDAFGGAPDVATCVESALGPQCFGNGNGNAQNHDGLSRGRCEDAFQCAVAVTVPTGAFRVTLWDIDVASDDQIGNCFFTAPGTLRCGSATVIAR